jgi:hypothetical protein
MSSPRMVAAVVSGRSCMYYLVDERLDFIPEVKEFLDWKAATGRAPATIKSYCYRCKRPVSTSFSRQLERCSASL